LKKRHHDALRRAQSTFHFDDYDDSEYPFNHHNPDAQEIFESFSTTSTSTTSSDSDSDSTIDPDIFLPISKQDTDQSSTCLLLDVISHNSDFDLPD